LPPAACGAAGPLPLILLGITLLHHREGPPITNTTNYQEYHARIAARLRGIAAGATTIAVKARLLSEAEEHERIARGQEEPVHGQAA
jgi:hypothetical protein